MAEVTTTGRCLCGSVRFEIKGDPVWVGHCHCQSCRRNTGSAMATFVGLRPQQVRYTTGTRSFFESSPGVRRGFCKDCGTPLSYEADRFPDETHLYLCTLDNPQDYGPTFHVFFAEKIPWFDTADALPRHRHTSKSPTV